MMQITSRDRMGYRDVMRDIRNGARLIHVCIPTFTDGDYDANHDSSADPTSATYNGLGRTPTWTISAIYANIRDVDLSLIQFGQAPVGATIGDTSISVGLRDKDLLLSCLDNKDAYIVIDGDRLRPTALQVAGVGKIEEYVSILRTFHATYVATGY